MPAPVPCERHEVTIVPATVLGGPSRLRGNFILADLPTVTSPGFWISHPKARITVNCIGMRHGTHRVSYPQESAISLKLYVEVRSNANLPVQFATTVLQVEKALEAGNDVVLHCRESFHRTPAVLAAYLVRLCGVSYKVDRQFMVSIIPFDAPTLMCLFSF